MKMLNLDCGSGKMFETWVGGGYEHCLKSFQFNSYCFGCADEILNSLGVCLCALSTL